MKGEGKERQRKWKKRGWQEGGGGGGQRGGGFKIGCREQLQSIVCHLLNYLLSRINVQETSGRAPAAASRRLAPRFSTACSLSKQHPADPGAAAILVKQQQGKVLENKRRSGSSASRRSLTIHSVSFLAVSPARKQRRMRERRRRTYLFGHWADCRGRIKASTGLCGRSPSTFRPVDRHPRRKLFQLEIGGDKKDDKKDNVAFRRPG